MTKKKQKVYSADSQQGKEIARSKNEATRALTKATGAVASIDESMPTKNEFRSKLETIAQTINKAGVSLNELQKATRDAEQIAKQAEDETPQRYKDVFISLENKIPDFKSSIDDLSAQYKTIKDDVGDDPNKIVNYFSDLKSIEDSMHRMQLEIEKYKAALNDYSTYIRAKAPIYHAIQEAAAHAEQEEQMTVYEDEITRFDKNNPITENADFKKFSEEALNPTENQKPDEWEQKTREQLENLGFKKDAYIRYDNAWWGKGNTFLKIKGIVLDYKKQTIEISAEPYNKSTSATAKQLNYPHTLKKFEKLVRNGTYVPVETPPEKVYQSAEQFSGYTTKYNTPKELANQDAFTKLESLKKMPESEFAQDKKAQEKALSALSELGITLGKHISISDVNSLLIESLKITDAGALEIKGKAYRSAGTYDDNSVITAPLSTWVRNLKNGVYKPLEKPSAAVSRMNKLVEDPADQMIVNAIWEKFYSLHARSQADESKEDFILRVLRAYKMGQKLKSTDRKTVKERIDAYIHADKNRSPKLAAFAEMTNGIEKAKETYDTTQLFETLAKYVGENQIDDDDKHLANYEIQIMLNKNFIVDLDELPDETQELQTMLNQAVVNQIYFDLHSIDSQEDQIEFFKQNILNSGLIPEEEQLTALNEQFGTYFESLPGADSVEADVTQAIESIKEFKETCTKAIDEYAEKKDSETLNDLVDLIYADENNAHRDKAIELLTAKGYDVPDEIPEQKPVFKQEIVGIEIALGLEKDKNADNHNNLKALYTLVRKYLDDDTIIALIESVYGITLSGTYEDDIDTLTQDIDAAREQKKADQDAEDTEDEENDPLAHFAGTPTAGDPKAGAPPTVDEMQEKKDVKNKIKADLQKINDLPGTDAALNESWRIYNDILNDPLYYRHKDAKAIKKNTEKLKKAVIGKLNKTLSDIQNALSKNEDDAVATAKTDYEKVQTSELFKVFENDADTAIPNLIVTINELIEKSDASPTSGDDTDKEAIKNTFVKPSEFQIQMVDLAIKKGLKPIGAIQYSDGTIWRVKEYDPKSGAVLQQWEGLGKGFTGPETKMSFDELRTTLEDTTIKLDQSYYTAEKLAKNLSSENLSNIMKFASDDELRSLLNTLKDNNKQIALKRGVLARTITFDYKETTLNDQTYLVVGTGKSERAVPLAKVREWFANGELFIKDA